MLFLGPKFIVSLDASCNSPPPLMGVVQVALAQTQPAGAVAGKARTGARSEGVHRPSHAQHIPNNRCMNQNHLLSISLTFSLDAQPAARFFTPGTRTIHLHMSHQKLWFQLAENKKLYFPETCFKAHHLSLTLFPHFHLHYLL